MVQKLIFQLLFILFISTIFAEESRISQDSLILKIELSTPKIFKQNDNIYLDIKLINNSPSPVSTFISDDKKYCFDFQILTMQNQEIEHSKDYITSFHRVQTIFKSKIDLEPNQGYSYKISLNDYFEMDKTGQFYIKGFYYPELKNSDNKDQKTLMSNQLTINIKPKDLEEKFISEKKSVEEEKRLNAEKRAPDEIIEYMLNARMNKEWEKYFLYLDLEKLILTNNLFKNNFLKADSEKQKELIAQFKIYLQKDTIDDISYLPHSYEIVKTEYFPNGKGKVEVIIQHKYIDYIQKKYYTYFLYKREKIWYVYSYEVMNMERL
jgi:hypothetical protein